LSQPRSCRTDDGSSIHTHVRAFPNVTPQERLQTCLSDRSQPSNVIYGVQFLYTLKKKPCRAATTDGVTACSAMAVVISSEIGLYIAWMDPSSCPHLLRTYSTILGTISRSLQVPTVERLALFCDIWKYSEEDIQPAQTCFDSVGRVIAVLGKAGNPSKLSHLKQRKVSRQVRPRCGLRWSLDSSSLSRAYITSANIHVVCY
ncbi:hypothetical protein KCU83_g66, partial [Aureobasidium melanogenum]